jgi:putative tricarboxylic transport membrane protein
MDVLQPLISGFGVALSPVNLVYVTLGVLIGTVIGLLPGLGPVAVIALLLPLTFDLDAATAIIMLAGIYYGAMYGGRIPAILVGLPGDASSVITVLDGYPLTRQGRAGSALGITAIGSFLGGSVAIIGLTLLAVPLAAFAGSIGAPEVFMLALFGLMMVVFLGSGARTKALVMAALGLILGTVGLDPITGGTRLTAGNVDLMGGIHIVPIAVGLFGIGEILYRSERGYFGGSDRVKIGNVLPTVADWVASRMAIVRSAVLGFLVGVMPGGGGTISSVLAYAAERRFTKQPEKFGKGAIDGLAATETADNASSNSSFVPLLTLGLPPNPALALMFGALMLHNVTPGPRLIEDHPDVFWGVIASMYIGNVILLILNLPLIGVFVQLLRVRGSIMAPLIIIVAICGVYSVQRSMFDVGVAVVLGVLGYLLRKLRFELGPFILAFILGTILEVEYRRSMLLSDGSLTIFFDRPVTLGMMAIAAAGVLLASINRLRNRRSRLVG